LSPTRLNELLEDPKKRISPEFQVPPEIRDEVRFWFKIYSKYSLYQTLLYDRDFPEVVYDVVDNRDLFKKGWSAVAIEITTKKSRFKKVLAAYRDAIQRLRHSPATKF